MQVVLTITISWLIVSRPAVSQFEETTYNDFDVKFAV